MSEKDRQLKIGLVSPYSWASQWGVNRQVGGLAATLAAMGHDVAVIAPVEERGEERQARKQARLARRAARANTRSGSWGPGKPPGKGVRFIPVSGTFRFPYSASLANLALPLEVTNNVNRILAGESFDILHLHEPYPPSLSFTALRLARCPVVATFHTAGEHFLSYQLMRGVVERFFSRLDARICNSHHTRRVVSGYFPGTYEVLGGGVDVARFAAPASDAGREDPPLVAYAAWSDPRKSLGLLLRMMRLLPSDVLPFQLSIVGGEELLWRANLIVPRRLRQRIRFRQPRKGDVADLYRSSTILCAPYATSAHAGAILEAMAAGNALIVPGEGGLRELVGERSEGLLLDHPYSYNLPANLVDLLGNERTCHSLARAAARKAARQDWQKIGTRTVRIYHGAHSRRQRRRPVTGALEAPRERTILADLHMHTNYSSDCKTTPAELLAACEECGLEAIAITDHNEIDGAREVARLAPPGMQVIIGEEIKTTQGEIIGLYLKEKIPARLTAEETIRRIREQGALVYVPHPFDPLHTTPAYELLARNASDIDIIEVYNPRITFASFNEKARRLARKYDIPGGAGSDCHVVEGVGTAMLSLQKFKGPQELLASLRGADIMRSTKSPIYLHSMKFLRNSREAVSMRQADRY